MSETAVPGSGAGSGKSVSPRGGEPKNLGFFARIALFIRQIIAELKKVVTPTRKELVTFTIIVIVFVAVMMLIIGLVDMGVGWLTLRVFGS